MKFHSSLVIERSDLYLLAVCTVNRVLTTIPAGMVSADNLSFDVLEYIFSYVHESDFVSISLVSSSFYDAIISRLYRKISFGPAHAKRYKKVRYHLCAQILNII